MKAFYRAGQGEGGQRPDPTERARLRRRLLEARLERDKLLADLRTLEVLIQEFESRLACVGPEAEGVSLPPTSAEGLS